MTDQANAVPTQVDNAASADADAANTGTEAAAGGEWWSGLQDEGNRKIVESKGWKDPDTAIKSYSELEKRLTDVSSKALTPPAPDAPQEQWDAFYAKLGRPEKPEAYEFKLPEDLPQDMPYDSEGAKEYQQWAHEAGLTPKQAQILHDRFARRTAGQYQQQAQAFDQRTTSATEALTKAWGGDLSSDSYKQNQQFADRFIANNGGDALMTELKANGTIAENGMILSPLTAMAFAKAGRALYKEDALITGGQSTGQSKSAASILYPEDPFKKG